MIEVKSSAEYCFFILGVTVLISLIPLIINTIRLVRFRKKMTKELINKIYRVDMIFSSIIIFCYLVVDPLDTIINSDYTINYFTALFLALLKLLIKGWPIIPGIIVLRRWKNKLNNQIE